MDLDQLKLLAGRVRGHLARRGYQIGHSQSLDISASLPGLRNWPEVMAFPDRVAVLHLDQAALDRLATRIARRTGLACSVDELRADLVGPGAGEASTVVWPSGPMPGIYVAASEGAVLRVIESFDEATDGALFYSDRVGDAHDSCFDLGEYGLFGNGIRKLPSGTLVIVSRLELTQETWDDARQRIQTACWLAKDFGHRVVVVAKTCSPATLCADLRQLVEEQASDQAVIDLKAMRGVVTEEGRFVVDEAAFLRSGTPQPGCAVSDTAPATVPANMEAAIKIACRGEPLGIIVLGHLSGKEQLAPLLRTGLRHTQYAGPACRVMTDPREMDKQRGPERRLLELPVMPSISAALAHGYRRIVIEDAYGKLDGVFENAGRALFLASIRAGEVFDAVCRGFLRAPTDDPKWIEAYAAILTSVGGELHGEDRWAVDGYLRGTPNSAGPSPAKLSDFWDYFIDRRFQRIEDDIRQLAVDSGLTRAAFAQAFPGVRGLEAALRGVKFVRPAARKGSRREAA